jgi:uncharacterized BrkB/YihY/UPF0761 family membrane protein
VLIYELGQSEGALAGKIVGALLYMAVFGAVISYFMQCLSFIMLRRNLPHIERPYRSPVGIWGAAIAGAVALVSLVSLYLNEDYRPGVYGTLIYFLLGIVYFAVAGRHRLVLSPEEEFAMTRGEHGHPEREGYGTTHVSDLETGVAFRLFALLIPLAYVLVAGFGFAGPRASSRLADEDRLGAIVVDSIAAASRTSERARWLALIFGGLTTVLAAAGVVEVLRWVQVLAWRVRPSRGRRRPWTVLGLVAGVVVMAAASSIAHQTRADARGLASEVTVLLVTAAAQVLVVALLWLALSYAMRPVAVPWTAMVPGALLFACGTQGFALAVTVYFAPRAARASALYGSLGVALTLLVSLFLLARLAVAAEELNATMWERRHPGGRPEGRAAS